jgi:hypothetical protein
MQNPAITEKQVVAKIFDDLTKCINGIYERLEFMFLYALANGIVLVNDDKNTGTGIRADFGYLPENSFGAVAPWGTIEAKPLSDISRTVEAASAKGYTIMTITLDRSAYNQLRMSKEAQDLYGASFGLAGNTITPTPSQFNAVFEDEYDIKLLIIDRTVIVEKNGVQTPVKPFETGEDGSPVHRLIFLTSEQVGTLCYSMLAENDPDYRNANVNYQLADSFILASKYSEIEPLREYTRAQAIAMPIIDNAGGIFILNTQEAQELNVADTNAGGSDSNITIWEQTFVKADVIAALGSIGFTTRSNIGDDKLIAKINALSDEDESKLKAALEVH